MSELTFNKIAGAALATGLAMIGLGQLSAGIFGSEAPAKPGYLVEVVEEGGSEAVVADTPPDWGTVLATADVAAGEAVFENLTHDYPQRVIYRTGRDGKLTARIEDATGNKFEQWVMQPQ